MGDVGRANVHTKAPNGRAKALFAYTKALNVHVRALFAYAKALNGCAF
jgi:hypothetical protein